MVAASVGGEVVRVVTEEAPVGWAAPVGPPGAMAAPEAMEATLADRAASEREAHAATAAVTRCEMPRFETMLPPSRFWWG